MKPMLAKMIKRENFELAVFVALAVLAIFVYPLTVGPAAQHQGLSTFSLLLSGALTAVLASLQLFASEHTIQPLAKRACARSERLALHCTRLC
jgi:hypothetical protein